MRLLINAPVADAARKLGVSEDTIDGIRDRGIAHPVDWGTWERRGVIGLAAVARTRGPRDVVVWVTGPRAGGSVEMLAVRADRQKEAVVAFLCSMPEALRRTIERAGMDMDEGFVSAMEAAVPWAEIVIERCPGARAYRDGADTGRKQELQRRKRALPTVESADIHGTMWPFRQRPVALEPPEGELRERVFTDSPKRAAAYHRREDLTERCERDDTNAGATGALRAWSKRVRASGLVECNRCLGTRERWMDAITHDCHDRQTSGVVEGFNNRVSMRKRRCDGIFNVGSLCQRLTLDLNGYQLFGHI